MQQITLRRSLSRTRPSSYPTLIARRAADYYSVTPPAANKSIWILSPALDVLFVCGGLLFLVAGFFTTVEVFSGPARPMVFLLFFAILFADSHNAATILRLVEEPGLAKRHRFVSLWLPLAIACSIPLALTNSEILAYAMKLYLILIIQHVTAQAYGIAMIYLRKTNIVIGPDQIFSLKAAFTLIMVAGMVRQLSSAATIEALGLTVPTMLMLPGWTFVLAAIAAVISSLYAVFKLQQAARAAGVGLHPGAFMVLVATLGIVTLSGRFGALALYAPAFFHASQYLAVSTALQNRRANSAPFAVPVWFTRDNFSYWFKLACWGIGLYIVVPLLLTKSGPSLVVCTAAMFCAINFHHFAADAVIWRSVKPAN